MVLLAIRTGIPMSEWERAGEQAIVTALELLAQPARVDDDGRQMSG